METLKNLLFEVREHVAYITLNRPEVSNAMNLEMSREFYEAAFECEQSSDVRAVLITGAGRAFCSGGDAKSFAGQEPSRLPAYYRRITLFLDQAIHRLARMRAPVVMAVNGAAGGGGMSLACAGDIVLAGESARFTMAYTQIGLTPDGSVDLLPSADHWPAAYARTGVNQSRAKRARGGNDRSRHAGNTG